MEPNADVDSDPVPLNFAWSSFTARETRGGTSRATSGAMAGEMRSIRPRCHRCVGRKHPSSSMLIHITLVLYAEECAVRSFQQVRGQ
jgi:hypothetical protein